MSLIDDYFKLARDASYHYADDSCKEWGLASNAKCAALKIFDANPDIQDEIRSKHEELWSLNKERPIAPPEAE